MRTYDLGDEGPSAEGYFACVYTSVGVIVVDRLNSKFISTRKGRPANLVVARPIKPGRMDLF